MLDAYKRYTSRRLIADGQMIHLIKYEPPKVIPTGMFVPFCGRYSYISVAFCARVHSVLF